MSNESKETIADIVSEMRNESHAGDASCLEWVGAKMRSYSDRIEAAANHQFRDTTKMIPEEMAVSKMETTTPTCEKSSQVGNTAAMREALETITRIDTRRLKRLLCELVEAEILDGGQINRTISAVEKARQALSAPPRNCDVFEYHKIDDEFEKAMGFPPSKTADERDKLMRENWFLFKCWLFAEAKGETK